MDDLLEQQFGRLSSEQIQLSKATFFDSGNDTTDSVKAQLQNNTLIKPWAISIDTVNINPENNLIRNMYMLK